MSKSDRGGPSVLATALIVFLIGATVLAAVYGWALGDSSPAEATGAPATTATTTTGGAAATTAAATAMADMPGMSGSVTTASATATTAAEHVPYPAELPALEPGDEHRYTITLKDETIDIAPGVRYSGWTFDGTAPGPVVHVKQGDWVDVTLVNGGAIPHSIDFHAARVAPNVAFRSVDPGKSIQFRFQATTPGVFMYHCGTPPVLAHIANGMYGAIVVDPAGGLPKADHSYVLVASEWYLSSDGKDAPAGIDMTKARHVQPDWETFNGYAGQYKEHPLTADVGDLVRFYVVAAGPSFDTDFHVVGTVFDTVWQDGTTTDTLHGVQTVLVPAGGGMVFDTTFNEKGLYPFVSHAFASVDLGQVGIVNVGNVQGTMSH